MAQYKDVESIIRWLEESISDMGDPFVTQEPVAFGTKLALVKTLEIIKGVPTADVEEVKHGEWKTVYSDNGYHKECSECGSRWMLDSKEHICKETKRCYKCGAKMDGGVK